MRIGDEFAVELKSDSGSFHVANGYVEDFDGDDVIIVIPATRVKMAVKSSLAAPTPEVDRAFVSEVSVEAEPSDAVKEAEAAPVPAPVAQETVQTMQAPEPGVPLSQQSLDSSVLDD